MEKLDCSPHTGCPEYSNCFNVDIDGVRVCKAIYFTMVNSLPGDYEIIDRKDLE